MRLTVLGSGDAFGSGGRFQACFLLEAEGQAVFLDFGASSLVACRRAGVDPHRAGAVVVSHLHGDHVGGVPFLVLDGQFRKRTQPLGVAGPAALATRLPALMEALYPGSSAAKRSFEVRTQALVPGAPPVRIGPFAVTAFAADHTPGAEALCLRLEAGGKALAYSGDTAWCDGLARAAKGADLLLAEAYYASKRVPYHLDLATLAARLPDLGCRRVLLTHMSGDMLAAPLPPGLERASDGLVVEV